MSSAWFTTRSATI